MARDHTILDTKKFKEEIPELRNSQVEIYIDTENEKNFDAISKLLKDIGPKKFKLLIAVILKNQYADNLYKREEANVSAIKLKGGKSKNQNYRIYCKEIYKNGKKVVMVTPHIKKVQKNKDDPKIINIITQLKAYEYDL